MKVHFQFHKLERASIWKDEILEMDNLDTANFSNKVNNNTIFPSFLLVIFPPHYKNRYFNRR